MRSSLPALACGGIIWCGTALAAGQARDDCPELNRVVYEATHDLSTLGLPGTGIVKVAELAANEPDTPALAKLERHRSPRGTAFFLNVTPDTTRSGPWDTTLYVFGNEARPLGLRIDVKDHASYGVKTQWINEKLIFLQVWLGRIVAMDLIVDIENRSSVYAESANHGRLILPCDEKRRRR